MGHRNMMCSHMFDMEIEQGHGHCHPAPCVIFGNMVDFPNPNIHTVLQSTSNGANFAHHQLMEYNDSNTFHGNHYNSLQQCHPVSNPVFGCVAPPNIYNPYMIHSSSSRPFPVPLTIGSGDQIPSSSNPGVTVISMNEYGRHNHFIDNVSGACKRDGTEGVPVHNCSTIANSSSSFLNLSLNSGLQPRDESFGTGANLLDGTTFTPPEHTNGIMPMAEGSHRSMWSRSSTISHQLEPSFTRPHNYILRGNHMGQSSQPAGSVMMEQFGSNIHNGASSNWNPNYTLRIPYVQGRSANIGSLMIGNMPGQRYQGPSSSTNSAIILHPPPLHSHHQHLPLVQEMPVQGIHSNSYSQHRQVSAPLFGHPSRNNLHHGTINSSRNGMDSSFRYSNPLPSGNTEVTEHIFSPLQQLPHAIPEAIEAHLRIVSPENVAVQGFSSFYGVGNPIDQHRDMRLDVDSMSYEELLALQERIGDVNTGLSEEFISRNLKTRIHVPHATSSSPSSQTSRIALENRGTCIICQVEYEENETTGSLDCGHNYHFECIKQWLSLKNLCPICKKSALSVDKR